MQPMDHLLSRPVYEMTPEEKTLFIPLFSKAQPDNPLFFDPMAKEILDHVDYDFNQLRMPYKTEILVCQRAKKLDAVTRDFLAENPDAIVLHPGCGLDARFWRVDNGIVEWYDLDMPPVIELRKQFFTEKDRHHLIASSVTNLEWLDQVDASGKPVLVVAEGLLMYLNEEDVRRLVLELRNKFPGCRLAADVFSRLAAKSASRHRSLKQTGASLGWGIDAPREVETWSGGIRLVDEWYFSQDPGLDRLNPGYRIAYKLAGLFKVVNRAHRIVIFQLG